MCQYYHVLSICYGNVNPKSCRIFSNTGYRPDILKKMARSSSKVHQKVHQCTFFASEPEVSAVVGCSRGKSNPARRSLIRRPSYREPPAVRTPRGSGWPRPRRRGAPRARSRGPAWRRSWRGASWAPGWGPWGWRRGGFPVPATSLEEKSSVSLRFQKCTSVTHASVTQANIETFVHL